MTAVYRQYDQKQLDAQYSPRATVPTERFDSYIRDYAELSRKAREQFGRKLDVRFGASADETLDVLGGGDGAPVVIAIHGGYWRMLSKNDFLFPALALVPMGIALIGVNYGLAPGTRLPEIVRQCRAAVAYVHDNAKALGIDPKRIHVLGHSAGGHLGAMVMTSPMVKGGMLVSGLYDLEPVCLTAPQEWLGLKPDEIAAMSPMRLAPPPGTKLVLSAGGKETDEFRRQSADFGRMWHEKGARLRSVAMPEDDHFGVILHTATANTPLSRALVELVQS
jgi:arylformamidase